MNILETGVKDVRNVINYTIGTGALKKLPELLEGRREPTASGVVFFVDIFFQRDKSLAGVLGVTPQDILIFIQTAEEPSTAYIDGLLRELHDKGRGKPCAIVGMGGGIVMDVAKAVSNLLTNGGNAADYQGWDLVRAPGIFKIGIPTISGTGSEATRTCVMTNKATGLKLGMNSDHTVFDQVIMDPSLTKTVPRDQYFFTGMDAYIHCVEASEGRYRNAIGDAFSREVLNICRRVFLDEDMKTASNRENLMVASYLGGCAIATSYVGLIHPLSAGLSVVLGVHHCVANCMVMRAMNEFYPDAYTEFWKMAEKQQIKVPEGVCHNLSEGQYQKLYESSIIHEKPLTNALGENFKSILTYEKVTELFKMM